MNIVSRKIAVALAMITLGGATAATVAPPASASALLATTTTGQGANPFGGRRLYVDPASMAATEAARLRPTQPASAAQLDKIAASPVADWYGDWNSTATVAATVRRRLDVITAAGAYPLLVVYNIPLRDCGSYSGGGAASAAAYRAWIDQFILGLGGRAAAVVLEPDALAQLDCLAPAARTERLALLKAAVNRLAAQPGVAVYLDAGHAGWVPTNVMVSRLVAAGVVNARGISLNVSNFGATGPEVAYGRSIAAQIGWKRVIIDTSRNGAGAASGPLAWCNPAGRALGARPGSPTGDPLVDAFVWVKRPGESDGDCERGEPAAGTWWTAYAIDLASRSS